WSQGNTQQAERAFLQAVALNPADSRGHFLLGLLYENTGRTQEALEQYKIGLRTDPSNANALAAVRRLSAKIAPAPSSRDVRRIRRRIFGTEHQ
ncbi:MAG: tetratricopeptide repeat protein, partial [Terriglobia bacterium]